jgi:DNA-binding CsgD family transcriptional regulator
LKLDVGGGVMAYIVEQHRTSRVVSMAARGVKDEVVAAVAALTESFPPPIARAMHAPTEFAGNAAYRLNRVAAAFGTSREDIEARAGHRLPAMWGLIGGDPRRRAFSLGLFANAPIDPQTPYPQRRFARRLGLVGAHLAAGLRLRSALAPRTAEDAATEAVLTPRGDVLHATGPAVRQRRALVDAALRSERARLRQTSEEEALELWRALVSGRWSIVDMEERDGKRLLLARRNRIASSGSRDLTLLDELERDVVWLAAMGHSLKFIAYELGISTATVTRRLASALKTLGIPSRRDLVRFFSARRTQGEPGR